MNIGGQLRAQRIKGNKTQAEVASEMHKDVSSVSKIENGNGHHQLQTIEEFATALDCKLQIYLFDKCIASEFSKCREAINELNFEVNTKESKETDQVIYESKSIDGINISSITDQLFLKCHSRYRGFIIAELQNKVINCLLENNLFCASENEIVIRLDTNDYGDLFDDVCNLIHNEKLLDEYGYETGWRMNNIVRSWTRQADSVSITLWPFYMQHQNMRGILESIRKDNIDMLEKAELYLEQNAYGFPFICDLQERDDRQTILQMNDDGDINLLPGKRVCAWSQDEAIEQYLQSVDDYVVKDYFDKYLVDDIIERIYYDELDYEMFDDSKKVKAAFDKINKQIGVDDEQEYKTRAEELITKEMLFHLLGKEGIRKFFIDANMYYVSCFLTDEDKTMYEFIM